jgi:hypothetical protein
VNESRVDINVRISIGITESDDLQNVCDNGVLLIIKLLCWKFSDVLVKFKIIRILEAGSASLVMYHKGEGC